MKCMGRLYTNEIELAKTFGLPEGIVITNVIHDPLTGTIEFIVRSNEPTGAYTQETESLNTVRRVRV